MITEQSILSNCKADGCTSHDNIVDKYLNDGLDLISLHESNEAVDHLPQLTNYVVNSRIQIASLVRDNNQELLDKVNSFHRFKSKIFEISSKVDGVLHSIDKIRLLQSDPLERIEHGVTHAKRMFEILNIVRNFSRLKFLIYQYNNSNNEKLSSIPNSAKLFEEIDQINNLFKEQNIHCFENEMSEIFKCRSIFEIHLDKCFYSSIENMDYIQLYSIVNAYARISVFKQRYDTYLDEILKRIYQQIDTCLVFESNEVCASGTLKPGGTSVPFSNQKYRAQIWRKMNLVFSAISQDVILAISVIKVFMQTYNKLRSSKYMLDFVFRDNFFQLVIEGILKKIVTLATEDYRFRQCLEFEYPKLLSILEIFTCPEFLTAFTKENSHEIEDNKKYFHNSLIDTFTMYKTAYLSNVMSRLNESVDYMIALLVTPYDTAMTHLSNQFTDAVIREIVLSESCANSDLQSSIMQVIVNSFAYLCNKCEQRSCTLFDFSNYCGTLVDERKQNVFLMNFLFVITEDGLFKHTEVTVDTRHRLENALIIPLYDSLRNIFDPVCEAILSHMRVIILSMHSICEKESYLDKVESYLSFVSNLLSEIQCQKFRAKIVELVAARTVTLFTRHLCLVECHTEAAVKRCDSALLRVQHALASFLSSVAFTQRLECMQCILLLKHVQLLFSTSSDAVYREECLGSVVPYSLALSMLFARSDPASLQPPHKRSHLTLDEYSKWLDQHPDEQERIQLYANALTAHVHEVDVNQCTEFDTNYPSIKQVLGKVA